MLNFPSLLRYGRSLRWLGLLLATGFSVVSLSLGSASAQDSNRNPGSDSAFCVADTEPLSEPVQGRSYGDPHINTYDGLHYSFQLVGEFILTQAEDAGFEVQARQKAVAGRSGVSLNSAVAMRVCGHRVAIYAQDIPNGGSTPVWIDGIPSPFEVDALPLPGGGEIQRNGGDNYAIIWPSGDQVIIRSIRAGGDTFLNIMPTLRRAQPADWEGLLGNFNGSTDDDLMGRGGSIVPAQSTYSLATNVIDRALPAVIPVRTIEDSYFDMLYRQFGDSWRIQPSESLFDYPLGQSTADFTDTAFPRQLVTLNGVAPARIDAALTTCQDAGVDEALLDGCVFDVAATGDNSFANAAANAIANAVVQELTDRVIDEVLDSLPIPRFPF
ncbi:VWD domain-containing protein [Halomicronema sp. CCY15110]|uniref:VWD domain-containing protein n=1 Tax=Halomicronema sp. CCY15110 TaxID=2767773 RepID=UPI00194E0E78|nr:VWD domain-containing protein [Halomicronema sp. CCY15110]